jgi:thiamine-monophosphate kinase
MKEYDIIRDFAKAFRRGVNQLNCVQECDSELVKIGDQLWGLTIDEFTPEEDLFTSDDPRLLGANLATATLSDLLAAGATPAWFMHSVALPKTVEPAFLNGLSIGISSILDEAGCVLCGGDMGCAETWRFCGFAMGAIEDGRPLTRIMPAVPQSLWVTGELGDANLAALLGSPTPRFELRLSEARAIKSRASACIDTSGGFFDALWLLHDLNPKMRMEIDMESLPIAPGVKIAAASAGFLAEAALLGGAGEYELLFALPGRPEESAEAMSEIGVKCVGTVEPCSEPGVFLRYPDAVSAMTSPPPCPRDAATVREHVNDVMQAAERLFAREAGL